MRNKIYIATKTAATTPDEFWRQLETSLHLLQTDYLDLYQFHCVNQCYRPEDGTGMYECMPVSYTHLTELLESELFGYEPGAFSGASKNGKPGKFELANHGTILLDEIGEMPQTLQSKLLRVLQEQEFERIGGINTIKVNVRIICCTNQDLSLIHI